MKSSSKENIVMVRNSLERMVSLILFYLYLWLRAAALPSILLQWVDCPSVYLSEGPGSCRSDLTSDGAEVLYCIK